MVTGTVTEERTVTVTVDRHNAEGDVIDTVELDASIFGVTPNVPLMHQVVTAQLAARRSGTHSTKTRSEVRGGGAKPYRQKGTGRARQGTTRAPQFAGGGVAFGPKPRSYAQRTPRKMVRLALCSALSDRLIEGKLRLIDGWPFEVPRTKDAIQALRALTLDGRIVIVLASDDTIAERSFGNLPEVYLVEDAQLTAYEVLANDWIVFTTATIPGGVTVVEGSAEAATAAREAAAEVAAEEAEAAVEAKAAAVAAEAAAEAEVAAAVAARDAASASDGETSAEGEDSAAAGSSSTAGADDSASDSAPDEDESEDVDLGAATSTSEADSPTDDTSTAAGDVEAGADAEDAEGEVSRPGASSAAVPDDEDEDDEEEEGE